MIESPVLRHLIFSFMLLLGAGNVHAEVISSTNFEDLEPGMPMSRFLFSQQGFETSSWDNALESRTKIDSPISYSGIKSMRITYPKDTFGPEGTGCQVRLMFDRIDEAFASYRLRFSENFSWGTTSYGGKLPGLAGGDCCSGGATCDGTNGFSARLMWRAGGKISLYLYHMDKPSEYGEYVELIYPDGSPVVFERGKWYHVAERVRNNSAGDVYDGEVEIWIDGKPVLLMTGLRFTANDDKVDCLYISTFHGGDDNTWCPTETCYSWLDDIRIGTTYEDVSFQSCEKPDLGADMSLCSGSKSYLFKPNNDLPDRKYVWLFQDSVISRERSFLDWNAGEYILSADSAWCNGKDTVVLFDGLPLNLGPDAFLCRKTEMELSPQVDVSFADEIVWSKDGARLPDNTSSLFVDAPGIYSLSVSTSGCGTISDTLRVSSGLLPVEVEESGEKYLFSVPSEGSFSWYADASCQDRIGEGGTLLQEKSQALPTYYVKDENGFDGCVGKRFLSQNAWTREDFSSTWMLFTVERTLTIDSISIYPVSSLDAVVRILDDVSGEVVYTCRFPDLEVKENRLPLQVTLPEGKYRMDALGTTGRLYHSHSDEDICFPYEVDGLVSIEGANQTWMNEKGWYMFFYDWRITAGNYCAATPVCVSAMLPSETKSPMLSRDDISYEYRDGTLSLFGIRDAMSVTLCDLSGKLIRSVEFSGTEENSEIRGLYVPFVMTIHNKTKEYNASYKIFTP